MKRLVVIWGNGRLEVRKANKRVSVSSSQSKESNSFLNWRVGEKAEKHYREGSVTTGTGMSMRVSTFIASLMLGNTVGIQ